MQSTPSNRNQLLQSEDRVTMASLQQKYSVRAMAQVMGRSPMARKRLLNLD